MSGNARDAAMSSSPPRWESIDDELLHEVWASDQAMYPAPELTYERLKSLHDACPELSICLRGARLGGDGAVAHHERGSSPVDEPSRAAEPAVVCHGLIVVWPLPAATYWDQLLDHAIKEHDVEATMFPSVCGNDRGKKKTPVGLHVFHIERFSGFQKARGGPGFTRLALQEVRQRVAKLEGARSWDVVGYSGE